jgi:cholesterol oxidase
MTGLRFTEQMRGYVTFGEPSFERGHEHGRASDTALEFRLTIEVDDVERLAADPGRAAVARGSVRCEALGGRFPVEGGAFHLFLPAAGGAGKRMVYRLPFTDGTGHPLTLDGVKRLEKGAPLRLWPETTTLYTRLVRGHGDGAEELVAAGILRIQPRAFARQLTTFRAPPAVLVRFAQVFLREMWRLYGRPW